MVTRSKQSGASSGRRPSVLARALEIAHRGDRLFVSVAGGLAGSALAALSAARSAPRPTESGLGARSSVDLVSAVAAEAWDPLASGARIRDPSGSDRDPTEQEADDGHSPGVVPLLRALGRIVAEHRPASYATLDQDERFWTLLWLLQSLGRHGQEPQAPDDDRRV
jgi:hypothetical protein